MNESEDTSLVNPSRKLEKKRIKTNEPQTKVLGYDTINEKNECILSIKGVFICLDTIKWMSH